MQRDKYRIMMNMHWLIFGALNVVGFSVAAIFQKLAMKKSDSDPVTSSIIFEFLLATVGGIVAYFVGFTLPPSNVWVFLLIIGLLYAYGNLLFFKSIKTIEASEMSILGSAGTLVSVVLSYIFLNERLSGAQIVGVLFILAAVVVINYNRHKFQLSIGAWQALGGAACFGTAIIFDAFILRSYTAISYLPVGAFIIGVILLLSFPKSFGKVVQDVRKINRNLVIYGVLYTFAALMFYLPLQYGTYVSQLSAIGRVSIILTVILSAIFLKERSHIGKKIIGAILTTIGIFLIR